jgi:hypothetical protein
MGTSTTQQNAEAAAPNGANDIANTTAAADVDHPEGDAIRRQVSSPCNTLSAILLTMYR